MLPVIVSFALRRLNNGSIVEKIVVCNGVPDASRVKGTDGIYNYKNFVEFTFCTLSNGSDLIAAYRPGGDNALRAFSELSEGEGDLRENYFPAAGEARVEFVIIGDALTVMILEDNGRRRAIGFVQDSLFGAYFEIVRAQDPLSREDNPQKEVIYARDY